MYILRRTIIIKNKNRIVQLFVTLKYLTKNVEAAIPVDIKAAG